MPSEEETRVAVASGPEAFPSDAEKLKGLYTILLVILGLALLMLIGAWFWLALEDKPVPEGMPVLAGAIGGGLVGVLTKP